MQVLLMKTQNRVHLLIHEITTITFQQYIFNNTAIYLYIEREFSFLFHVYLRRKKIHLIWKKKQHPRAVKNHVRGFLYSVLLSELVEGTPVIRTANDEIFPLTESAVWPNPTIPWPRGSTLGKRFNRGVRVGGWGAIRAAEGRAAKGRVVGDRVKCLKRRLWGDGGTHH